MKILAQGIENNTIAGFERAAVANGYKWIWWEEKHTPTFDVFDEVQPDIVFVMKRTRAIDKCLRERQLPFVEGTEHPFQFYAYANPDMEGKKRCFLECDALVDSHMFCSDVLNPEFQCDIGICCEPNPIGLQICEDIGLLNIKIMSETQWSAPQYLGIPTLEQKRDLYRSSTMVLVDSILEAARVASCGSVPVFLGEIPPENKFGQWCLQARDVSDIMDYYNVEQYRITSKYQLSQYLSTCSYDVALKVLLDGIRLEKEHGQ